MNGRKVELLEMLEARDYRFELQQRLLTEYKKPLISFTMNIAGPIKNNSLIRWAFDYGNEMLEGMLAASGIFVLHKEVIHQVTGNEAFYVVSDTWQNPVAFFDDKRKDNGKNNSTVSDTQQDFDTLALKVKKRAMQLEDNLPIGRLFDIDILDPAGKHLDRVELGGKIRSCLICDKPAKECGRSRAHTVEELQKKTEEILQTFQNQIFAEKIAELAVKSLLFEVGTTPKPGLVDLRDNGSHKDMDVFTFMSSASALFTYFQTCTKEGILAKKEEKSPKDLFERLRFEGILAETKMRRATGGVNTHKGAIFSLGILCGALGMLQGENKEVSASDSLLADSGKAQELQKIIKAMTKNLSVSDTKVSDQTNTDSRASDTEVSDTKIASIKRADTEIADTSPIASTLTTGQKLYKEYGIRGARGEAEDGFPTVFETGLPMLHRCLNQGMSLNEAGVQTLLAILSATIDTNMIARSDYETALAMKKKIMELRNPDGFWEPSTIEALNQEFIEKNLSPGGSADLLSLTYFLYFISD